ncbi:elongation factor G [Caldisalinibacter kiritimatiensis]|uniref:Elongation factor G n=1 Tax=Caldisalinibacter kiritimatiensis TaxID=1304284 RepID=R1AWW6_9FIRM|nr:elongation factor G [Caldisalinibacter kiritimatiensis]EOD01142.1 Translation elongation factor G-related protein [Caldisalinibacter kiritimatiensis]
MKEYKTKNIRNVALVGHGGSGKTTLTEAMLFTSGAIKRMGKVEDGSTVSDFDKEEKKRQYSIGTSVIPVEWNDDKYNFLDTPGYFDFVGEVYSALRVASGAIILVDASSGVEVGTEKVWKYTSERKMPRFIFVNKMDKENVKYEKVLNELREKFGKKIAPFAVPMGEGDSFRGFVNVVDLIGREYNGKECIDVPIPKELQDAIDPVREMLIESVAESDEELLEKYFEGEEFTTEEIHEGLRKGVLAGDVVPVLVGSAIKNIGVHSLLGMVNDYLPTPKDGGAYEGVIPDSDEIIERKVDENEPFSALVFKTIVDPFVGKISVFKVCSGSITKDMEVLNPNRDEVEKIGSLFALRGKTQVDASKLVAGDIGATSKLQHTQTGDTLCDQQNPIQYEGIKYPRPCLYMAVDPKSKDDEEKISSALHKLTEEDPTFVVERNRETKQQLIGGQGNIQLAVITSKLKNIFGVEVDLSVPKVAYRETIKGRADVQGKHKKQTGGAGQYGDVHIRFEPTEEDFEFGEEIFGGAVPKQYIPAVEKGLRECMEKGVLAGYPVVNVKAVLHDGSYHSVDSSEMAFKVAASLAFKKGIKAANPVLLEPIMKVEISVPEEYMGDIMGDMNKRRGRILGMEPQPDGSQLVIGEAPQSELFNYAVDLKSMTHARGSFSMEFSRYDEVPQHLSQKIIEEAKAQNE